MQRHFSMDISGRFFQINIDYFTTPIPLAEFNEIRQKLNLEILNLMEGRKIVDCRIGDDSED